MKGVYVWLMSFDFAFPIVFEIHGVENCVEALVMTTHNARVALLLPNRVKVDGQGRHSRSQGRHGRQGLAPRPGQWVVDGANARRVSWLPNSEWREAYYVQKC